MEKRVVVGISGASGVVYGYEMLKPWGVSAMKSHVVITERPNTILLGPTTA
jgi:3-polyprenyl-4-hydroxybenzoate decarboxylase